MMNISIVWLCVCVRTVNGFLALSLRTSVPMIDTDQPTSVAAPCGELSSTPRVIRACRLCARRFVMVIIQSVFCSSESQLSVSVFCGDTIMNRFDTTAAVVVVVVVEEQQGVR